MTSPATQEPCPNCDGTGKIHGANPCRACKGTGRAPPSQRAELLTQELESAMAKLRTDHNGYWDVTIDRYEAAALLQHIAALQSQLDTAQKDNLARHRQCGELRTKVAALTQRVEAAETDAARYRWMRASGGLRLPACLGELAPGYDYDAGIDARIASETKAALSQEPRDE